MDVRAAGGQGALRVGLFLVTLATLLLELLDARLLSVLTWYHVSFLALSLAMLGMAAGAVFVLRRGARSRAGAGRRLLRDASLGLALSIPLSHWLLLRIPIPADVGLDPAGLGLLAAGVAALTVPFFLSGVVVTLALTRLGTRIGILYGFDLLGAALGCLLAVPLMDRLDVSSATLGAGAVAAAGAAVLAGLADPPRRAPAVAAGLAMLALAGWNASGDRLLGPTWAKGQALELEDLAFERWNAHSYVVGMRPRLGPPAFWGKGEDAPEVLVESMLFVIDGAAGTPMTAWDGDRESLAWVQYDVTSLPYQIRRGDVAVIGVGGGRDVLSALWFRNPRVTGIELNRIFVDVLEDSHRGYAGLADRPEVRLVNAEARSFLSRSDERFDVIQMSLVDTWASTGAGAFTLSENGLYTVEGWRVFLDHLKPDGVLSVSRWFASNDVSETSRLLSLAVASLLERGVREPARHLVLAARGVVATLLVSPRPFSAADVAKLRRVAKRRGFSLIAAPGVPTDDPRLRAILASEGPEALAAATRHPHFDYSPPTDRRPYFFNLLKLGSFREAAKLREGPFGLAGVVMGNLRATRTLVALFAMASLFVLAVIVYPLLRAGRPQLDAGGFALCLAYFAGIGAGFMTIQIALLEVFTLFLGHPTYAYPVILFSMILFAGLGSLLSERIPLERTRWPWGVPLLAALVTLASAAAIPVAVEAAVREGLLPRIALVVGLTAPLSLLLGCCFPLGMRLLERLSPDAGAWAWGVNGAVGVLASIAAVAVSLGLGIDRNFWIAAALYAGVALAGAGLARAAREPV